MNGIIEKLEHGIMVCDATDTTIVHIERDDAEKIIALLKEQEVKTGYWIDSAGNDKCSICGAEYSDLYPDYGNTPFCPNCGAKMKGRRET